MNAMQSTERTDLDAVFFDFGEVLITRRTRPGDSVEDRVERILSQAATDDAGRAEVLRRFNMDSAQLDECLAALVAKYEPSESLWHFLPTIRRRYRVGVISNGTGLSRPLFERRLHLSAHFDVFITSGEEGVRKPNPAIYRLACKRIGVQPPRCLFIDDCLTNLVGAEQVGMRTIHWQDTGSGLQAILDVLDLPIQNECSKEPE